MNNFPEPKFKVGDVVNSSSRFPGRLSSKKIVSLDASFLNNPPASSLDRKGWWLYKLEGDDLLDIPWAEHFLELASPVKEETKLLQYLKAQV